MTRTVALAGLLLLSLCRAAAAEPPWINLFDGKSLKGWVQKGGTAKYEARDGMIVGSSVPNTKNSFLCTERSYGDFVLELEFKADPQLNSGIQIRGQSSPDYQEGRVHGYQVEIDPDVKRGRMWTGGLYDEGRRGWLVDLKDNEAARNAFRPEAWNKIRVEARGDSIKTWLNGVPAADLVDSMDLDGFIGLQVHQVGKREESLHVSWRNLRLQDLGRRVWLPLWDGKTLKGLRPAGEGMWAVDGGALVGTIGSASKAGLLFVDRPFEDFTARLVYRLQGGNGGLYVRAAATDRPAGATGLQVDLDAAGGTTGLYDTGGRGWVARADAAGDKKAKHPADGFRQVDVSAHGAHVVVHTDGALSVKAAEAPVAGGQPALELAPGRQARLEVKRLDVLSPPIPPPVPGYPVGWCLRVQGSAPEDAKAAGFEVMELALQDILGLSDEEFERTVARLAAVGIPARGGYNFIPPELKIVGPDADRARQDQHLERALARAARLGLEMVVLNTGPAIKVPDGFPRDKADRQLVDFGRRAAAAAARHKITVLVEPLRDSDSNILTKLGEVVTLAKAVHRPNFKILVDYSFLTIQHEDPKVLLGARGLVHHVWMANPNGRGYAMSEKEADYAAFFRALHQIGYRGGISVHARTDLFAADAPRGIAFLRQMIAEHLTGPGRITAAR